MGYGLGYDDPEEFDFYNWLIKEIDDMKKDKIKKVYLLIGIFQKEQVDDSEYFFSNRLDSYAYWYGTDDDYQRQKSRFLNNSLIIS